MPKKIDPEAVRETAELLTVYGSETRLALAASLHAKEMNVGELQEALGVSLSAVSQHLAKMRAHGLVVPRREAQTIYYRLVDSPVTKAVLGLLEAA